MKTIRSLRSTTPIFLLALLCSALQAQQSPPPTLDQILQQLDANLNRYDARIPSFFCDEHVVSRITPGTRDQNTVTDSIFRLKRVTKPDRTMMLDESRDVKTVNSHPAQSQDLAGPTVLSGAFEGGLALVSSSQRSCMKYALDRSKRKDLTASYVVRFASVNTSRDSAACLLDEPGRGLVSIDAATMQITHMELITPHHTIIPADAWSSPVAGRRILTVDYAPVALVGETFWMPSTITSRSTAGAGSFHQIDWYFKATYRNFHKLEVTSRIVPSSETPTP